MNEKVKEFFKHNPHVEIVWIDEDGAIYTRKGKRTNSVLRGSESEPEQESEKRNFKKK